MLKTNKLYFYFLLTITLFIYSEGYSQPGLSSPYTHYGVGYLSNTNNVRNMSMGGIGIGTRNHYSLNIKNPASFTSIDTNSFLFEGAAVGYYTSMQSENVNETMLSGSVSHIILGFPILKWWKTSIGLVPYSNVDYTVFSYEQKEDIGRVQYEYGGSGGLNQFYWANAFRPLKNLSVGVNASYIFGTTDKYQKVTFPDSSYMVGSNSVNSVTITDIQLELGVQYHASISNNLKLVVGGVFQPKIDMSAEKSFISRTFLGEVNQIEFYKDTVAYSPNEKGIVVFPSAFGFGFSLKKLNNWMIGADYKLEMWDDYSSFGESDSLKSSQSISIGGEYTPNITSTSYFNRIDYRMGAKFNQSYLELRNQQLNNFGITFGLGLPISSVILRRSKAMVNLGFELGTRGNSNNNLIQENYANFYFGLIINEFWFLKRKYN
ncbi:MAG: hypothetical protein DRJ05_00530 [Bacteroidetes bacterium]|nr:MAG: hypothetical protein DRJ05_00530 [Bacteroidota bacterium]